jgi:hypothetical protein
MCLAGIDHYAYQPDVESGFPAAISHQRQNIFNPLVELCQLATARQNTFPRVAKAER